MAKYYIIVRCWCHQQGVFIRSVLSASRLWILNMADGPVDHLNMTVTCQNIPSWNPLPCLVNILKNRYGHGDESKMKGQSDSF